MIRLRIIYGSTLIYGILLVFDIRSLFICCSRFIHLVLFQRDNTFRSLVGGYCGL